MLLSKSASRQQQRHKSPHCYFPLLSFLLFPISATSHSAYSINPLHPYICLLPSSFFCLELLLLLIAVNEVCVSFSPPPTSSLFSSSAAVPLQTTTTKRTWRNATKTKRLPLVHRDCRNDWQLSQAEKKQQRVNEKKRELPLHSPHQAKTHKTDPNSVASCF